MLKVCTEEKVRIYYELARISKSDDKTYSLGVARLILQTEDKLSTRSSEKMLSMVNLLKQELKDPSFIAYFKMRDLFLNLEDKRRVKGLPDQRVQTVLNKPFEKEHVMTLLALLRTEKQESRFKKEALNICLLSLISYKEDRAINDLLDNFPLFSPNLASMGVVVDWYNDRQLDIESATLFRLIELTKNNEKLADKIIAIDRHKEREEISA